MSRNSPNHMCIYQSFSPMVHLPPQSVSQPCSHLGASPLWKKQSSPWRVSCVCCNKLKNWPKPSVFNICSTPTNLTCLLLVAPLRTQDAIPTIQDLAVFTRWRHTLTLAIKQMLVTLCIGSLLWGIYTRGVKHADPAQGVPGGLKDLRMGPATTFRAMGSLWGWLSVAGSKRHLC